MLYDSLKLLEGSKIQNMVIESATAFPSSPSAGQVIYRSDLNKMYVYTGSQWIDVQAGGTTASDLPKITNVIPTDSTFTANNNPGLNANGAYAKIIGSGFVSGCVVNIGSARAASVTFVSSTELRIVTPAMTPGSYIIYISNPDGGSGLSVVGGTVVTLVDPHFSRTSAIIKATNTSNGQNFTFTDSSSNNFSLSVQNNAYQGSMSPFSPFGWSTYFNGTSDMVNASTAKNPISTGQFTVEMWIKPENYGTLIGSSYWHLGHNGGWNLNSNSSNRLYLNVSSSTWNSFPTLFTTTNSLNLNEWNHVALTRDSSNVIRCFINGVQGASITYAGSLSANTGGYTSYLAGTIIGAYGPVDGNYTSYLRGNASNARIITGSALYTADFTPPASALTAVSGTQLLACANATNTDKSSNAHTVDLTGTATMPLSPFASSVNYNSTDHLGSMYVQYALGVDSGIRTGSSSSFGMGTGNFTLECWVYPTSNPASGIGTIADFRTSGDGPGTATAIRINDSRQLLVYGDSAETAFTSKTVPLNVWSHIAIVKTGTSVAAYINGKSAGTAITVTKDLGTAKAVTIGYNTASSYNFNGFISNLRIVKGTAVYAGEFNPSTSPLTNISGTSLLLNFGGANIYDATAKCDLLCAITGGGPLVNTSITNLNNLSSISSDGTNDYVISSPSANFDFYSSNFTLEGRVYFITPGTLTNPIFGITSGSSSSAIELRLVSGVVRVLINGNTVLTDTAPTPATWIHYALTRSGNTLNLWKNGALVATTSITGNTTSSGNYLYLFGNSSSSATLKGNLQDVRVTKGLARYTSAFTVSQEESPLR